MIRKETKFHISRAALAALFMIGCGGSGGSATQDPGAVGSGGGDPTPGATAPATPGATAQAAPHSTHAHCGWMGADTAEAGVATFLAHPDNFDAIHPKWFTLNPDGSPRSIAFTDDNRVLQTARAHQVKVIPLIDSDTADYLRTIFSSPANISAHAQALTNLVVQHNYDGIELDYEHLFNATDRAPFVQLVQQTAAALHAKGKVLTLALPSIDHDDGQNAYDYNALFAAADVAHLMVYDYHYLGGNHLGPLAPLGWAKSVIAHVVATGMPNKVILGLANYGIGPGWYGTIPDSIAKCGGTYGTTTAHMQSCPYGTYDAGKSPNCENGANVWFEDPGSIGEKAQAAKAAGLLGIGYWTVGNEPDGFFDAIHAAYP
jgi:spore germination protein YaaH